jgi:hypothetical protein
MKKFGVRKSQHLHASGICAGSQQQQPLRLLPQAPGVAYSALADQLQQLAAAVTRMRLTMCRCAARLQLQQQLLLVLAAAASQTLKMACPSAAG